MLLGEGGGVERVGQGGGGSGKGKPGPGGEMVIVSGFWRADHLLNFQRVRLHQLWWIQCRLLTRVVAAGVGGLRGGGTLLVAGRRNF